MLVQREIYSDPWGVYKALVLAKVRGAYIRDLFSCFLFLPCLYVYMLNLVKLVFVLVNTCYWMCIDLWCEYETMLFPCTWLVMCELFALRYIKGVGVSCRDRGFKCHFLLREEVDVSPKRLWLVLSIVH